MKDNIFREYDIRGIVGKEINLNEVEDLTRSILYYFLQQNPNLNEINVGMDGRTHSEEIKEKVIAAANGMGISVTDIGLCPSPTFYFSLFNTPISSGLMITASHNPKEYNGIKICLDKKSVWGKQIKEIKNIYKNKLHQDHTYSGDIQNKKHDIVSEYIDWLANHFKDLKNHDIKAVIDCANATGGVILPRLIDKMGFKNVKLLFEEVDGNFPNHEADPTKEKNMIDVKKHLTEKNFEVGIGLDGDCDRMNPMTKSGCLVPGDKLLALYSKEMIKDFPGASVVFDIKSSQALVQSLEEMGAIPCMAPSGHSIIKEHMSIKKAKLAGELSCHFFFNDKYFGYDDAIYAALRLFEILKKSEISFDEMLNTLPKKISSPEYRVQCDEKNKSKIVEHVKKVFQEKSSYESNTIDGLRATKKTGWGLIRASNTQPVICLRFESDTKESLDEIKNDFYEALTPHFTEDKLKEIF